MLIECPRKPFSDNFTPNKYTVTPTTTILITAIMAFAISFPAKLVTTNFQGLYFATPKRIITISSGGKGVRAAKVRAASQPYLLSNL